MCKLVEVASEPSPEMLAAAQRGVTDQEGYVRSSALSLMCKLVEVVPELAPEMPEDAQRGFQDQGIFVRSSALSLMCKLVEVASELAPEMLAAAQRGVTDQEGDVRSSALSLMCKLVEVASELAPEMLAAAQRGVTDQEGDVRSSALSLMCKLVEVAPELADQLLAAAQRGFKDQEWSVRSRALSLMCKLVEVAPELADQLLAAAQRGVKDQEGCVRCRELDLMCKLVEVAPERAERRLAAAQRGFKDQSWYVRFRALDLMCKLVEVDPELAPEMLAAAQRWIKDQEGYVRSSALSLMGKLVERDAELAQPILEAAQIGIKDQEGYVRSSALSLMGKLVERDAELAEQMRKAAQIGIKDQEGYVRDSALSLMGKLVERDAELAEPILEAAQIGFTDQDMFVRSSALELMGKLFERDAELAEQMRKAAQIGITDQSGSVRSSALFLMGQLVESAPELAEPILEAAQIGIKDQEGSVRYSALSLMCKLVEVAPERAETILEEAKTGLKDKEVNVTCTAFELLRKLAKVLAKPEIERDALAQLKAQLEKETWRVKLSVLQAALTFTKLIPASAQQWLKLVPYGLRDEASETQEAAISLGVELAFHLPDEAIVFMLLEDPELSVKSVRECAKKRFTQRLQDKTVTYSSQDILVLNQLLLRSTADSELDEALQKATTQKLLELAPQVAEHAGIEYLNTHFNELSHSPAITAFLKKVMHQALADQAIQLEADFIIKCILQHGITATIAPGKRLFVLEETRYTLEERSEAHLQHIVNSVIEASESEFARQYRTHQPLFGNTGKGLPIAASDIPRIGSVVHDADLTTTTWHLSVMHLSDHHQQAPQSTFLLLEQRNYEGEHVIKKITYAQGQYTLAYKKALNPTAIDTKLRKELFGSMEYKGTKPRYYATCYTLSQEAAQELLDKINQQAGEPAQDAYQALHQLAFAACQADHDEVGSEQLDRKWRAYIPNAQELEKAHLLQLSQEDAAQVRRDSLVIADREENREKIEENKENIEGVKKDVESHENILDVTGIASKAEITKKLEALQANHPKLYAYCHTFIWTLSRYIAANGIASTGMFSQEVDQGGVLAWFQVGMAAAEHIPVFGDFAGLIGTVTEKICEGVKTAQQENKAAVHNRIIQDHHLFPEDVDLTIRRAGLEIVKRKEKKIEEAVQATIASTLGSLGSKIEDFKHKILGTYQIAQSPQAGLALEDVLALLVRMYKEYETLNQPGGELYEQLAALVCMGSLSDLLSQSTAVTQEDLAQAERALAARASKKDTINKLKQKAGEGLWKATMMKRGKECEEFFAEANVRRYIEDSQPGVEPSDNQVVAMRMVLFRHMCAGIQEYKEESLACAQKFAAKYPDLVEKLAKEYPHYFVSQAIARACITDPSLASEVMSRLPN